jgi:nucleoside-diphosphate-sugar epimerase
MYIDDFIPTLSNAVKYFRDGNIINIGGEEYRSVEDLHRIIIEETGNDMGNLRTLDEHNVINKRPDIKRAKDLLGHDPKTPLEEGIKKTIEWMKEVYK